MAMKATQIALDVKGVNRTGKVFKEIAASAWRVSKTAAFWGGGALVGAGAAFAATARSLGHLSDVAMQAGQRADEITKLSSALNVLGIKAAAPEQIALAFQKMTKETGAAGLEGFKRTVKEIAKLGTAQERSARALRVFSDAGLSFMPLIEAAAKDGGQALDDVIAAMPEISDAAANAGDAIADGMQIVTDGAKALWSNACGAISAELDAKFAGGAREAAMRANAYMEYFAAKSWRACSRFVTNMNEIFAQLEKMQVGFWTRLGEYAGRYVLALGKAFRRVNSWKFLLGLNGDTFAKVFADLKAEMEDAADRTLWRGIDWSKMVTGDDDDLEKALGEKLAAAARGAAAVGSAAVATASDDAAKKTGESVREAVAKMRNEFMTADTYKAATLSLRADYGSDRVVRGLNAIRGVNERNAATAERIATALANIQAA